MAKVDYYKKWTGKTLEEHSRLPKLDEIVDEAIKSSQSRYSILTLGEGETRVSIRQEEREHIHIIGTTREGKSKFLEHLIRRDIDEGRGVCLLDPSDMGDTVYNVLRYCQKKNIKKVCLIDPFHATEFKKVPVINPFHSSYQGASVANVMEMIRTVFGQTEDAQTPRINKYLPAILKILWSSNATLRDSVYFTLKEYELEREKMFESLDVNDRNVLMLRGAYRTVFTQESIHSTINRLQPFFDDTLSLIFGSRRGINFPKMIAEGWVILVNLYSGFGFEPIHTRLLGTAIIHELIFGVDRLIKKGWKGNYHLYIDEAGRYATRTLANALNYMGKAGFWVTLAHQYYDQFEDQYVLGAVEGMCKTKVAFYIPNRVDRDRFVRNAYGGDLSDRDVSHVLSGQKKQYAVIKKPKRPAHIVRIPDVESADVSKDELNEYIKQIYQNEWYKTPEEITKGYNRFNPQSEPKRNPVAPSKRTILNRQTTDAAPPRESAFARANKEGLQPRHRPPRKNEKG